MPNWLAKLGFPRDSALPRDVLYINPTFESPSPSDVGDTLKNHLAGMQWPGATNPFTIKVYSLDEDKPHYPHYEYEQAGTPGVSAVPREVSLCLSYYAGRNVPRSRGRLYIPFPFIGGATAARPTVSQRDNVILVGDALGKNLASGMYWTVYSRLDKVGRRITNYWCDDEWDTVRRRGLRSTARTLGTI